MLPFALLLAAQQTPVGGAVTAADIDGSTKVLRVAGLHFPGDSEYRTVTIELLTFNYGPQTILLNGWILIDEFTRKKSFLAWNGLTYDEFDILRPASIEDDLKRGRAVVGSYIADFSAEYWAAIHPNGTIAALLLQSTGLEDEASVAVQEAAFLRMRGRLVTEAVRQFDNILTSRAALHIKYGRIEEAYDQTRSLRRLRNFFDEILEARGVRTRTAPRTGGGKHWIIDAWLVDLRRRLVDARTPEMSLEEIAKLPQEQQIDALVEKLDDAAGLIHVARNEIENLPLSVTGMLGALGQSAIDSLIPHMNDRRMSLYMGQFFPFNSDPTFETTGAISTRIVLSALALSSFPNRHRQYDLDLVQRYWNSVRGLPLEEQWLHALEFEEFGASIWASTARNLSAPPWVKVGGSGGSIAGTPQITTSTPKHQWTELDERQHDAVVNALEMRVRQILDGFDRKPAPVGSLGQARTIATALAAWDIETARPILKEILKTMLSQDISAYEGGSACVLASALIYSGDEDAWDIYEAMLNTISRDSRTNYDQLFAPLWQHYDDPRAKQIAHRLFETEGDWSAKVIVSRFLSRLPIVAFLPEFRRGLLAGFDDTAVALTATRTSDNIVRMAIPGGSSGIWQTNSAGTHVSVGRTFDVRWCDLLAIRLVRYNPRDGGFDPAWPLRQRDAFIAELKNDLMQDEFDWSAFREAVRPRISTFDPVFATSLPPRPNQREFDRFGVRPRFNIVEPGIVPVRRLGSSEVRKFGRWGGTKSRP